MSSVTTHGYVVVMAHGHPNADSQGRIYEHRLVASQMLGRPLLPSEDVHHINRTKRDNRPENLKVCDRRRHGREHDRWTAEMDRLVLDMRERGLRSPAIAVNLGVTSSAVQNRMTVLRQRGVQLPPVPVGSPGTHGRYAKAKSRARGPR